MGRNNLSPDTPHLVAEIRGCSNFLAHVMRMNCFMRQGWETAHSALHPMNTQTLVLSNPAPEKEWDTIIQDFSTEFHALSRRFRAESHSDSTPASHSANDPFDDPALCFRITGTGDIDAASPDESLLITPLVRVVRAGQVDDDMLPGSDSHRQCHENTRIDIFIESGWAFGTGSHPSTVCSVMAIEKLCHRGMIHSRTRVLDMGTGTGILAITAALMGAGEVTAVDVDPEALSFARRNVRANNVENSVRVMSAEEWSRHSWSDHFNICLANLTLSVASCVMPSIARSLRMQGVMMLAGFKCGAAPAVHELLWRHGLEETENLSRDGWCAVFATFKHGGIRIPHLSPSL